MSYEYDFVCIQPLKINFKNADLSMPSNCWAVCLLLQFS